jgi:hypothetical protein
MELALRLIAHPKLTRPRALASDIHCVGSRPEALFPTPRRLFGNIPGILSEMPARSAKAGALNRSVLFGSVLRARSLREA